MPGLTGTSLSLTRAQILAFRRRAGALDKRLPYGPESLRQAAWAGLQDSMPRAAVLSLHARVNGTQSAAWDDPSLIQLWGPRFSVFVVAAQDHTVFSLGLLPDTANARRRAEDLAERLRVVLKGTRMPYAAAGRAMGVHHFAVRYAAATGTILIRWEGSGQPVVWTVPPPDADPREARLELVRRYLRIYGPSTAQAFGEWSGLGPRAGGAAFDALQAELTPVRTPVGDAWISTRDEAELRAADGGAAPAGRAAPARLLPSGDPYFLLHGADRDLLIPDAGLRDQLWTPRAWPGALLVGTEIAGTWRRAGAVLTIQPWRTLTTAERGAVAAEAESLPLGLRRPIAIRWEE